MTGWQEQAWAEFGRIAELGPAVIGEENWWDAAAASSPDRARHAVWGEPEDRWQAGVDLCLDRVLPWLDGQRKILDVGCGVGRLTIPVAEWARPMSGRVYGLDTSGCMLGRAIEADTGSAVSGWFLGGGHNVPRVEGGWDAVFSVVTFQHVDRSTLIGYLSELAQEVRAGGMLRFQHVIGGEEGPLNHPLPDRETLQRWLDATGWQVEAMTTDTTYPDWVWVSARKTGP